MMRKGVLSSLAAVPLAGLLFVGCANPNGVSNLRAVGEQQRLRVTKETDQAVLESPALRALDDLCARSITHPAEFVLVSKRADFERLTSITYGFQSRIDSDVAKNFYANSLTSGGWRMVNVGGGGWGPAAVEFEKDQYKVKVYLSGVGEPGLYAVRCEIYSPTWTA